MDSSTNLKKSNSAAKLQKKAKRNGSDSTRTDPDSGYDSPSPEKKLAALKKENTEDIEPVPVVWASGAPHEGETAEGGPLEHDREQGPIPRSRSAMDHSPQTGGADVRRSQSMRSNRIAGGLSRNYARDDRESMHTTPSGRHTPRRRKSLTGGSFANGPGMVGPNAKVDDEETKLFRTRSVTAEAALTKKEKSRIGKAETKEGKRVAKVIKEEARAEKKALEQSIRELSDFQKIQKYAVKEEAKTTAAYAQALKAFHKEELAFLAARAKFERAEADLQCHEDARDAAREHASDATEMLQDKNREIEWMRAQKHADDREREIRLRQLAGKPL
ncbi:hypothetical protein BDY19DRAFT_886286 [Irpex rosettiformis]|uniref:Uncharacterized protein n=1 Tax=Irpex rosettiformis TaxID=378272 RepID=A0ACB8UAH2_9APHY|nr:hypothetical protein BDY19DRAFT_886286 [Irpex rosettiformis]